jgi:hypothetical protein
MYSVGIKKRRPLVIAFLLEPFFLSSVLTKKSFIEHGMLIDNHFQTVVKRRRSGLILAAVLKLGSSFGCQIQILGTNLVVVKHTIMMHYSYIVHEQ